MIRPIVPAVTSELMMLAERTGLFDVESLKVLQGVFEDYHRTNAHQGHQILTCDQDGKLIGIAYFAPRKMTDRTWELLMIVVDPVLQRQGIGSQMLGMVEDSLRASKGRILLIETSSLLEFEGPRQFYRSHGYIEAARIPDGFADGDDIMIFAKRIAKATD